MPMPLLDAYAENLPRLSAEESLLATQRVGVGTGSFKKSDRRRLMSAWERQADHKRPKLRAKSREMYAAQMAGLGIGVKLVKPDG